MACPTVQPQLASVASERRVQPLGIGLPYLASLPSELYRPGLLEFVEITPETLCRERREGTARTIELIPDLVGVPGAIAGFFTVSKVSRLCSRDTYFDFVNKNKGLPYCQSIRVCCDRGLSREYV